MKKIAYLSLILGSIVGLTSPVYAQATDTTTTQEVKVQAEKAKGIWIDVRSPEEYAEGHLEGAINIPHTSIAEQIFAVSPNKDEPINLYCRSGRRAGEALKVLEGLGYKNVTNHGGYQDLLNQGLK